MSKLIEVFARWALKNRRWPLLLPLLIPLTLRLLKEYLLLSLKDTLQHPSLIVPSGGLLVVTGVLYWAVFRQDLHRLWLSIPLSSFGITLVALGISTLDLPPLPNNRLVVSIVRFRPVSPDAASDADNFSHRLEQKLIERIREGAPLEVKRIRETVEGSTEEERRDAALSLGRSKQGRCHVVIWGEIRKDEGELFVKPYVSIASQMNDVELGSNERLAIPPEREKHLEFKEQLSTEIAELTLLIYGYAYYQIRNWNQTIGVLQYAESSQAHFYKARAYLERSEETLTPRNDLKAALAGFEAVVRSGPINLNCKECPLIQAAYCGRVTTLLSLALHSPPQERYSYLQRSISESRNFLEHYPQPADSEYWAIAQEDLGTALSQYASFLPQEERSFVLRQAITAYDAALSVNLREARANRSMLTQMNLATALLEMSFVSGGYERVNLRIRVEEIYAHVIAVTCEEEYTEAGALAQNNLGSLLCTYAEQGDAPGSVYYLQQALWRFRSGLKVCTREKSPRIWALLQTNVGHTLYSIGARVDPEPGFWLLNEAWTAVNAALEVRTESDFPNEWAHCQNLLGSILLEKAERKSTQEGIPLVEEAISRHQSALRIYVIGKTTEEWAKTQILISRALLQLHLWRDNERDPKYLKQSLDYHAKAVDACDAKNYPELHKMFLDDLQTVFQIDAEARLKKRISDFLLGAQIASR